MALESRMGSFVKRASAIGIIGYLTLNLCGCGTIIPENAEKVTLRRHGVRDYIFYRDILGQDYTEREK